MNRYLKKEQNLDKYITVQVSVYDGYLLTFITDDGRGFNVTLLGEILLHNNQKLNGRGVYMSKQMSDGIYYNHKGNGVLSIHKISR